MYDNSVWMTVPMRLFLLEGKVLLQIASQNAHAVGRQWGSWDRSLEPSLDTFFDPFAESPGSFALGRYLVVGSTQYWATSPASFILRTGFLLVPQEECETLDSTVAQNFRLCFPSKCYFNI